VNVNLPRIRPEKESLLAATFPNAEISGPRGVPKGVVVAASVVAGLVALCCLAGVIGLIISR
jgi:hypothetical protein